MNIIEVTSNFKLEYFNNILNKVIRYYRWNNTNVELSTFCSYILCRHFSA